MEVKKYPPILSCLHNTCSALLGIEIKKCVLHIAHSLFTGKCVWCVVNIYFYCKIFLLHSGRHVESKELMLHMF
jgi:hypothetical protein